MDKFEKLQQEKERINAIYNEVKKAKQDIENWGYAIEQVQCIHNIKSLNIEKSYNEFLKVDNVNDVWNEIQQSILKSLNSKLILAKQKYEDLCNSI